MSEVKTYAYVGGMELDTSEYTTLSDRIFREAWSVEEGEKTVYIDMDLAKEIWRDKIRRVRKKLFTDLDTQFMLALETGADTTDIVAQKQLLRDAPQNPAIDAATTPDELKQVQPIEGITIE